MSVQATDDDDVDGDGDGDDGHERSGRCGGRRKGKGKELAGWWVWVGWAERKLWVARWNSQDGVRSGPSLHGLNIVPHLLVR